MEEERHQHALMALDSSVLGCGSDDWSVDGDYYAFQDFPDDVHKAREHQRSASSPDRVLHRDGRCALGGRGRVSRSIVRAGSCAKGEKAGVQVHVDSETGGTGPGANEEAVSLPELQALVVRTEENAGSGREEQHPAPSDARLLRDPGSSTDSTQILRLEQRMFLKVTRSPSDLERVLGTACPDSSGC